MLSPKEVCKIVSHAKSDLATFHKTLDFLDGSLEDYLLAALKRQLSDRVFMYARERLVPINIFPRYVEKLSNIYQTGVIREVIGGNEADTALVGWYTKQLSLNERMHLSNKLYNACNSSLLHPYMTDEGPKLRVIPNDRFVCYSNDPIEPTKVTDVVLLAGKDENGLEIYWVYGETTFQVVKSDETIDYKSMAEMGIEGGVNPYGVLPFVYVNKSPLRLRPFPDLDSLRMTEYVPIALTDLNLAAMFSSFAITYLKNGTVEDPVKAPNALWFLKSDDPEKDVEIGTLKPEVDYQEVLNLIQSELSLWFGSKGIKAASVGNLTVENYASGIAKIIDEADTFDVRQQQTVYYSKAEYSLWELILRHMHPVWSANMQVENRTQFSPGAEVITKFSVIPVGTQRAQLIAEQKEEYSAGFTTRKRAIASLNPQMTMQEVEELLLEIDQGNTVEIADRPDENQDTVEALNNGDQMAEDQN